MSNAVNEINKTIEQIIKIRDNRCVELEEKDALAYACNILEDLATFLNKTERC